MLSKTINNTFKNIRSAKISIKLTLLYSVMFSLVLLILNASILYGIKFYFYLQANRQIEDIKTIMIYKVTNINQETNLYDRELFSDIPPKQNISIRILDKNGKNINTSSEFKYVIKFKQPYDKSIHIEEEDKHLVFKAIKVESKNLGTYYLQIVKDMENEYDFIKILFVLMAIADAIGILASIIIGYVVSKKMLKPIDNITKTAENISINNLKERLEVEGPDDELKRLGTTFNKMIDRLQEAFNRQNQFVSDASHELKTPIAVIQGYANLLDRWGKDDREALEKSIHAIKFEASNMADLVEKLLFLAKGDSDIQFIEKKEFMLNELIDEVVSESRLIAPKHIITNNKNDSVSIIADYKMLKQMLRIFIDNSVKFSPEHSEIDISLEKQGNKVNLTISDSGIGIPENEIKNIFHRFYTVDKSRSKEKMGTGLGLAIAKWIIDVHFGVVKVESKEEKYTKVIVTLNIK